VTANPKLCQEDTVSDTKKTDDKGKTPTPEEQLAETKAQLTAAQAKLKQFENLQFPGEGGVPRKLGDVTTDEGFKKLAGELGKATQYEKHRKLIKDLEVKVGHLESETKKPKQAENTPAPEPPKARTRQEILDADPALKQRVLDGEPDAIMEIAGQVAQETVRAELAASRQTPAPATPSRGDDDSEKLTPEMVENMMYIREVESNAAAKAYAAEVARVTGASQEDAFAWIRGQYDEKVKERGDDMSYGQYIADRTAALKIGPDGKFIETPAVDKGGAPAPEPGREPGDGTKQPPPASAGGSGAGGPGTPGSEKPMSPQEFNDELRRLSGSDGTDAPGPFQFSPSSSETNRRLGSRAPQVTVPDSSARGIDK